MGASFFTNRQRGNRPPIQFTLDIVRNPLNCAESSWANLFIQDLDAELSFKKENQLYEHKRRETLVPQ
jgi:hypothetical protein